MSARQLWVGWLPIDGGQHVHWSRQLLLDAEGPQGTLMILQERGGSPYVVSPEDARALAAALLAGAEEVERTYTAACWLCSATMAPRETGLCVSCELDATDLGDDGD